MQDANIRAGVYNGQIIACVDPTTRDEIVAALTVEITLYSELLERAQAIKFKGDKKKKSK